MTGSLIYGMSAATKLPRQASLVECVIVLLLGLFTIAAYVACWIWLQDFRRNGP